MFEIVAPAGDVRSLAAAVLAGADGVYFGFRNLNARTRAANFTDDQMLRAIAYLRERGIRSYVTLNTLIREEELSELEERLGLLAQNPPDALIFQDLAVVELARRYLPSTELHASTQVGICNRDGLEMAARLGATRAVVARELSGPELKALAYNAPIELEVFVFGAMCCSASGFCYASLLETGRSGNRGACAQLCRTRHGARSPFSMKDLDLLGELEELTRAGIRCFKIEGRMKGADYVYETVSALSVLRKGRFSPQALRDARDRLRSLLTRERGTGYYHVSNQDLFTESRPHLQVEAGRVEWSSGDRVVYQTVGTIPLRPGDRVKIRGAGATVTASSPGRLVLSTPLPARAGEPIFLFPNPDRVAGVAGLAGEIRRHPIPRAIHLFVEIKPEALVWRAAGPDGEELCRGVLPADTAEARQEGVTGAVLAAKLATPALRFLSVDVAPNRLVLRHSDFKALRKVLVEVLATHPPRGTESVLEEYPPFQYEEPSEGAFQLPPVYYDRLDVPARGMVQVNNLGQLNRLQGGEGRVLGGRFLPVINRVAAFVWRQMGVDGFLEPHELRAGDDAPHFVLRVLPRNMPEGFFARREGEVYLVYRDKTKD